MNPNKVSFGFTKKIQTKNLQETVNKKGFSDSLQQQESLTLQVADIKDVNRKLNLNEEKFYSITPPQNNRDGFLKKRIERLAKKNLNSDVKPRTKPLTLDEMAVKELCEESSKIVENSEEMSRIIASTAVDELTKGETGVIPSLYDYEEMPIPSFGEAILHGLGWKKGHGIGKNAKVVEIVEPSNRTFGLIMKEANNENEEKEEEVPLKKGSCVLINGGRNKGKYGTVLSLDIDHCLIKLARDQSVVREIEQHIEAITSKEFKDGSRVINKEMYDQFKEAENQSKKLKSRKSKTDNNHSNEEKEDEDGELAKTKINHSELGDHRVTKYKNSRSWLIEGIRVKIVGKSFRKGRHYKEKVVVKSLDGKDSCTCLTEDNKLLNEIYEGDLETVIPRRPTTSVLIVNGSLKGKVGIIVKNDKERQEVTVEIEKKSIKKGYDDVSEYIQE